MPSSLTVRDLMETTYITLRPDMPVSEAVTVLIEHRVTGAPVVDEEDHVLGLLAEKQCLRSLLTGAYDRVPAGMHLQLMLEINTRHVQKSE